MLLSVATILLSGCGSVDFFQPAAPRAPRVYPPPGSSGHVSPAHAQDLSSLVSRRVTVTGTVYHGCLGAVVLDKDGLVLTDGMKYWREIQLSTHSSGGLVVRAA